LPPYGQGEFHGPRPPIDPEDVAEHNGTGAQQDHQDHQVCGGGVTYFQIVTGMPYPCLIAALFKAFAVNYK